MRGLGIAIALQIPLQIAAAIPAQDGTTSERKLATIPADLEFTWRTPVPDGTDAQVHSVFRFGAGGRFVVYNAQRKDESVAMVGDRQLGQFTYLSYPFLDASATHYGFRAGIRKSKYIEEWFCIIDGERTEPHGWIGAVALGSTGKPAYWAMHDFKLQNEGSYDMSQQFWVGDRKGKEYQSSQSLMEPSFSDNGRTVVTAVMHEREWFVLTARGAKQGIRKPGYPIIEDVIVSPNGARIAVVVMDQRVKLDRGVPTPPGVTPGKRRIVFERRSYGDDTDGAGAPMFAPDNKRLTYKFLKDGAMGLAFHDEKNPPAKHQFVGNPAFDEKGDTIAYASCRGGKVGDFALLQRYGPTLVRGGTWSLHRRKHKGQEETLVENSDRIDRITFGPGGKLAYAQKVDDKWHLVVGQQRSPAFDYIGQLYWSDDGKKIEFGARSDRELWWRVFELK